MTNTQKDIVRVPRSPAAHHRARQAAYARRQADGSAILRVLCPDYFGLISALLVAGRISEGDALDRTKVEAAIAGLLADWAGQRWPR
jgi:hypothetical protein